MTGSEYILTGQQIASIEQLFKIIGPEAASNSYCTKFNVLRWITAYRNDLQEAAKQLKRHLRIRKIKELDTIQDSIDDFDKTVSDHFPIHVLGKNRFDDNKVLVWEPTGRIDIYSLIGLVQITPFMKNRFRVMEKILRKINEYEEETKRISGGVLLIDLDGLVLQPNLVNILKGPYRIMWGTLFEQYPEMFSQVIVVNAPKFMNVLWAACTPFIDAEVRNKIKITSSDWQNEIFEYIDPRYLPQCYGGTLYDDRVIAKTPPSDRFPSPHIKPIIPLEKLSIPAGGILVQVYRFDEGTELEFYMNHQDEFTLVVLYSMAKKTSEEWNEDELEEVYAACERPGLDTTDYWRWKTPYSGYYYLRFGNEKAWFLSATVQCLVSVYDPNGAIPVQAITQF